MILNPSDPDGPLAEEMSVLNITEMQNLKIIPSYTLHSILLPISFLMHTFATVVISSGQAST